MSISVPKKLVIAKKSHQKALYSKIKCRFWESKKIDFKLLVVKKVVRI